MCAPPINPELPSQNIVPAYRPRAPHAGHFDEKRPNRRSGRAAVLAIWKAAWKRFFFASHKLEILDSFEKDCEVKDDWYVARGSAALKLSARTLGTLG